MLVNPLMNGKKSGDCKMYFVIKNGVSSVSLLENKNEKHVSYIFGKRCVCVTSVWLESKENIVRDERAHIKYEKRIIFFEYFKNYERKKKYTNFI